LNEIDMTIEDVIAGAYADPEMIWRQIAQFGER
jgi:hypothetical protein